MAIFSEEWAEIAEAVGLKTCYYYNYRTGESSYTPVVAAWRGARDPATQKLYYWRVGSSTSTWRLPPTDSPEAERKIAEAEAVSLSAPDLYLQDWEADDTWVQVESSEPTYYWNVQLGITTVTLPSGHQCKWTAHHKEGVGWYFCEMATSDTRWHLPFRTSRSESSSSEALTKAFSTWKWLAIGAPVSITDLQQQPRFNDQVGVIVGAITERVLVQLPSESAGVILALKLENLRSLQKGTLVELCDLSTAVLHGKVGTVLDSCASAGSAMLCYKVRLIDGSEKAFKATNIKPKSRLWNLRAAMDHGKKISHLQWRAEQSCVFVDSSGQHRNYQLALPIGFDPIVFDNDNPQKNRRYPLIVYMHGAGGETLFTYSKKSLRTPGMNFAAEHFVVVTPKCDWTWRESPKEWVIELIEAFRAVAWIDYRRIYLTGLSMGGMSVWEVASRKPELFAAIAPVAAHHKPAMSHDIAKKLASTPLFAIHGRTDGTCSIAPQEALWRMLCSNGNTKMLILVKEGVDHCRIHEHAYCNDDTLYSWFLQHTLKVQNAR